MKFLAPPPRRQRITWFRYVPHARVHALMARGWGCAVESIEGLAPVPMLGAHGHWCVLMWKVE